MQHEPKRPEAEEAYPDVNRREDASQLKDSPLQESRTKAHERD